MELKISLAISAAVIVMSSATEAASLPIVVEQAWMVLTATRLSLAPDPSVVER